MLVTFEMEERV